jgi:hypothetical protein
MIAYMIKHWRGELTLRQSFWVNLVLPHALLWLPIGLEIENIALVIRPDLAAVLFLGLVVFVLTLLVWQAVGVARAAQTFKRRTHRKTIALTAQIFALAMLVVHLPILFLVPFRYLIGMGMVFFGLTDGPFAKPKLYVYKETNSVILDGPLALGISRDLQRILEMNPELNNIILSGPGGSAYEAKAVYKLIKKRSLNTISLDECSSACAIAFLGGVERVLSEGSRLGFHSVGGYSWDASKSDISIQQQAIKHLFQAQNIEKGFIETALGIPPDELWYPSYIELKEAGVVTNYIENNVPSFSDRKDLSPRI